MGCGGSVSKQSLHDELEASERELDTERRRLQEKDSQIASVQECLQKQLRGSEQESTRPPQSVEQLRGELEAKRAEHAAALQKQKETLGKKHEEELQSMLKAREDELCRTLGERAERAEAEAATRREAEEVAKAEIAARLSEVEASATSEVERHRAEVEAARTELRTLESQGQQLRAEHGEAAEMLREARRSLRLEQEQRTSGSQVATLEHRLAEAQREHERAEQRHGDVTAHLKAQLRDLHEELHVRAEDLRERDATVLRRDQELEEVNSQLKDLQGLFDEVNGQLQRECGRIERLQGAVTQCAKQAKELESLQNMLEESHRMLAQLRETLEKERAERIKVAALLEHEQQRTQLLLDVLKHFKEKLQGLTPQMLLSRLGVSDAKAALLSSPGLNLSKLIAEASADLPSPGLSPYASGTPGRKGPPASSNSLNFAALRGPSPKAGCPGLAESPWQAPSAAFEAPPEPCVPSGPRPGANQALLRGR
mmetsp:Transcript_10312/g.24813  ORF Transcript_10312/g.24813 Transcript_10312/m.24813 type:complete len:485 (+) Transcript_10312:83-1537(+)